jgi:hypothetical protein
VLRRVTTIAIAIALAIEIIVGCTSFGAANTENPSDAASTDASAIGEDDAAASLGRNLVAHWSFDEGNGPVVHDLSDSGRNADRRAGGSWTQGVRGSAIACDGTNQLCLTAPMPGFDDRDLSAFAWVKGNDTTRVQARILGVTYREQPATYIWLNFGPGRPTFEGRDSTDTFWDTPANVAPPIGDDNWHHVGFVVDRAKGRVDLFVDGTEAASQQTNSNGTFGSRSTEYDASLGSQYNGPFGLKGEIDEVRIYDRALSPAEVRALFDLR